MRFTSSILFLSGLCLSNAALLLDYQGGQPASALGNVELEGSFLGDKIPVGSGDNTAKKIFIDPATDPVTGQKALHFHRDPAFRRTEVKSLADKIQAGKTYYIGYHLRLEDSRDGLVIMQWKKHDKTVAPIQNIPFHLEFAKGELTLGYTVPGGARTPRWSGPFTTGKDAHKIGLVVNTNNSGSGFVELWIDGERKTRLENINVFTGPTSPKFGLYRSEGKEWNSWVYRVQISDSSKDDVKEAAGW